MSCLVLVFFYFVWGNALTCRGTQTHTHTHWLYTHRLSHSHSCFWLAELVLCYVSQRDGFVLGKLKNKGNWGSRIHSFADVTMNQMTNTSCPSDSCNFEKLDFDWNTMNNPVSQKKASKMIVVQFVKSDTPDRLFPLYYLLCHYCSRFVLQTIKYAITKMCQVKYWLNNANCKLEQNSIKPW